MQGMFDTDSIRYSKNISYGYDVDSMHIHDVYEISDDILHMAKGSTGSGVGTGGMATKLVAAQIATASGADMVITNGENVSIVEEFLDGEELSLMCLFDGKTRLDFAPCRDFKKLYDDINAPNTGGMGAYCPVRLSDFQREKLSLLKKQLQEAFLQEGMDFSGIIYAGLIFSRNDFYVLDSTISDHFPLVLDFDVIS